MYRSLFAIFTFVLGMCSCGPKETQPERSLDGDGQEALRHSPEKNNELRSVAQSKERSRDVDGGDIGEKENSAKVDLDDVALLLKNGPVGGVRPISKRSLSLKVGFEEGGKAVFKPLRKGNKSARFEVAFSRLAQHLKVDGAPRAVSRPVPLARIRGHLSKHFPLEAQRFSEEVPADERGLVHGAMIEWMEDLKPSELDGVKGKARIRAILENVDGSIESEAPIPGPAAVSDMIVLDYLTGNWDRFSGGNLFVDSSGTLILIDNNGAFSRWSNRQRERMEGYLQMVDRFSRKLIDRIRKLDAQEVEQVVRGRMGKQEILSDEEIGLLLKRRDEILARVEKVKSSGQPAWF